MAHTTKLWMSCMTCLERVRPYELKLMLTPLIEDKNLTLRKLNFRIMSFDYGFPDLKNTPSVIVNHELKNPEGAMHQSAAQIFCLLWFLPCMIGDLIPEENKHWELLLLLLECILLHQKLQFTWLPLLMSTTPCSLSCTPLCTFVRSTI